MKNVWCIYAAVDNFSFNKTARCFIPVDEEMSAKVINRSGDLEDFGHTLNQFLHFNF